MTFLDKTNDPYRYYLNALKDSIKSMVGSASEDKELCNKLFAKRMAEFNEANSDLPSVNIYPNHPQRLLNLACFVSEYVFKDALLTSVIDDEGYPLLTPGFGVEYYTYDFEGEFTSKEKPYFQNEYNGYYINSCNKLWDNIKFQPNSRTTLTKPDSSGRYTVINFKELNSRIKRDIKTYYTQHPELEMNLNPDENLQKIFGKVLGELSASVMKNNRTNGFNGSPYRH